MAIKDDLILILSGVFFTTTLAIAVVFVLTFYKKKTEFLRSMHDVELKNKELEMMNAVVQAQETERGKIARNLHDEVGSILSMAQRNLGEALKQIPKDSPYLADVDLTLQILDQSVDKILSISQGMLPHFLVKFGLHRTLERLMEQTQKTLGHPCTFSSSIEGQMLLPKQVEIHFYFIALELLNNLLKHAHPQSVHFILERSERNVLLKIKHDGVAISQADYEYLQNHGEGMGLESISHKLNLISGELQHQRHSVGGTIELIIPIMESEAP